MKIKENKWLCGAIPALLLHCSIGTVYCWSYFKADIASYIGASKSAVEWGFSIAIFVLGLSAAFAGDIVEQNIKLSSKIATFCFSTGLALTGLFVYLKSLPGILISYGVIMGIGLGLGYLSPVKTLMLWFKDNKGLATGIAIAGFGLAKAIASPLITFFKRLYCGSDVFEEMAHPERYFLVFISFAVLYFIMMFIGHLLLKKPSNWVEPHTEFKPIDLVKKPISLAGKMFKKPEFLGIWLMFYINITCGLALISQEKDIYTAIGFGFAGIMGSVTAAFNAGGRLFFSAAADKLKDRNTMYKIIFILSVAVVGVNILCNSITNKVIWLILIMMCIINATYGGGFSNLPTLLSDRYGMEDVSKIHGLALSAWGFAGLSGNQLASFIVSRFPAEQATLGYNTVLYVILGMYAIALLISIFLVKAKNK